jgi:hypothetical protein
MIRRTPAAIAALVFAASFTGCSDTPVEPEASELSQAEALSLAGQLALESFSFARSQDGDVPSQAAAGFPSRVPETVTVSFDVTRTCQWGGTVDSSGSVQVLTDTDVERKVVDIVAHDDHQACVLRGAGDVFTLDGDPDLTTEIHVASLAGELEGVQSVSLSGAVLWQTDTRDGRCAVDLLVEVNPDAGSQTTRGSFCGHDFDITVNTG